MMELGVYGSQVHERAGLRGSVIYWKWEKMLICHANKLLEINVTLKPNDLLLGDDRLQSSRAKVCSILSEQNIGTVFITIYHRCNVRTVPNERSVFGYKNG